MKVFEIGLVCEFEGGSGVLMANNDRLFANAKMYLLGAVDKHLEDMKSLYDGEDKYEKSQIAAIRKDSQRALDDINKSKIIADLKAVTIDESMLVVRLYEREVLGAELGEVSA